MTVSHKEYYGLYTKGVKERVIWEDGNLSSVETSLKTLENCRKETVESIRNAAYKLESYAPFLLSKITPLNEETSGELFKVLQDKYDFELLEVSTGFHNIEFVSRATISESDPSTNMNFSVDLGLFKTRIQFRDRLSKSPSVMGVTSVTSTPYKDNKPVEISEGRCYHPHINSGGTLCLGSYGKANGALGEDQKSFNILGLFYNLCSLLCRYNANSLNFSGAYINNWVGHKCAICFEFAPNAIKCEKSKNMIHEECAELIDGKYYGLDQIKKCSKCSSRSPFYITYSKDETICSKCEEKENTNE